MGYVEREFGKVIPAERPIGHDPDYKIKVTSAHGETRWINVSPQTVNGIKALLVMLEENNADG